MPFFQTCIYSTRFCYSAVQRAVTVAGNSTHERLDYCRPDCTVGLPGQRLRKGLGYASPVLRKGPQQQHMGEQEHHSHLL